MESMTLMLSMADEEFMKILNSFHGLLSTNAIPPCLVEECNVFFHRMRADYHWHLAVTCQPGPFPEAKDAARESYERGMQLAFSFQWIASHPLRLRLAFNFAIFTYEVLHDTVGAYGIARKALDNAKGAVAADASILTDTTKEHMESLEVVLKFWCKRPGGRRLPLEWSSATTDY